ncbi:hypothetical protein L6164_007952 [Bauhinia variegata]|uniref:Uncharacterized protein n=1 Tax=Bauhinia variegata TaxID=167791 RepID=A0ACB9PKM4_BAUVA|nr:hypothetical protein L6164_007952 [Bauhinia variegata]
MGEGEGGDCPPKNVSSDAAAGLPLDVPAKKLARQLDFTGFGGVSGSVTLPEHPQSQLHPQTQMVSQSQPQSRPQPQPQILTQPSVVVMPVAPQAHHPSVRVGKPESPKSRSRPNFEIKDATPKKQKQCNCKHSKCLKLVPGGVWLDGMENEKEIEMLRFEDSLLFFHLCPPDSSHQR